MGTIPVVQSDEYGFDVGRLLRAAEQAFPVDVVDVLGVELTRSVQPAMRRF